MWGSDESSYCSSTWYPVSTCQNIWSFPWVPEGIFTKSNLINMSFLSLISIFWAWKNKLGYRCKWTPRNRQKYCWTQQYGEILRFRAQEHHNLSAQLEVRELNQHTRSQVSKVDNDTERYHRIDSLQACSAAHRYSYLWNNSEKTGLMNTTSSAHSLSLICIDSKAAIQENRDRSMHMELNFTNSLRIRMMQKVYT